MFYKKLTTPGGHHLLWGSEGLRWLRSGAVGPGLGLTSGWALPTNDPLPTACRFPEGLTHAICITN